jgi:hypothetical protein
MHQMLGSASRPSVGRTSGVLGPVRLSHRPQPPRPAVSTVMDPARARANREVFRLAHESALRARVVRTGVNLARVDELLTEWACVGRETGLEPSGRAYWHAAANWLFGRLEAPTVEPLRPWSEDELAQG